MRKALLLAIALALLSGCLLFPPEEQTKYGIFSNLPPEGAVNAVLADVNGDAFAELISLVGTAMGGRALKNLHGAQFALLTYEDGGSAAIIKLNTTMGLNELMESLPGGYDELVNETKQINGKQVLLLYSSYDTAKENPLCMWREGEWLNFLYYQQGYESSINESLRCDSIMEKEYDTKKAEQLLAGSAEMKRKFAGGGKLFGEGMAYIEDSAAYISLFGDENGNYAVAMLQGKRADGNLCYNDSYSGGSAEVVKRGNKEACLKEIKESSSSYMMPMSVSLIYLERRVGNYSLMVVAYVKEKKGAVINSAEDIIFDLDFPGQEVEWTDRMTLTVNVYETEEGSLQRIPVADADVKLYTYGYSYVDYEYGGTTLEPVRSAKTDDNGIAKFTDLEIGSYSVEATKEGYLKGTDYVYQSDTNSSIMLRPIEPLVVTVKESYSYTGARSVAEAKVELYNSSGSTYDYMYGYTLLRTLYTNSSGVADFGKISIEDGKVVVSKGGYGNGTSYISTYSSRNVTVYLVNSSNGIKPLPPDYPEYNSTTAPAENCSGNCSLRVWPSEAATATCTGSNGATISSTGEYAADWFNYGGCGGWKRYNVTPGSQVMIHGYSDSCAGCSLWHINYYLHDYYNSSWHTVGYVDGPDEPGATYDFCYTPKGDRISIEAETGFYASVFKKD